MTLFSGIKYKDYVIYVQKEQYEANNSYIRRLWFIVKNITKSTYEELIYNSWVYVNTKFNNITYTQDIQQTLENYIQ